MTKEAGIVVRIILPGWTPAWVVVAGVLGALLVAAVYALVRLVRVALPATSAERLDWWRDFWLYRRELRRDRWERHMQQLALRERAQSTRAIRKL